MIYKIKTAKLDFIKIENVFYERTAERMKRSITEPEKIFKNHFSDKGLVTRMHKIF